MEENLSILQQIRVQFGCKEVDIKTYSPLTLAFIGDSIYDLVMRTIVVEKGNKSASSLHKSTSQLVNAGTQAKMIECLQEDLTEEEMTIFKRGRNAKSYTSAKNASIADYRKATGFEALVGYLYLTDQMSRILELIHTGIEKMQLMK